MSKIPTIGETGVSILSVASGTRARTDDELVASWVDGLSSGHTRRNFDATALRFLEALPVGLRKATVEDVRQALAVLTTDCSAGTARQYVLRIKSLLSYAHRLGYTPFNAGVVLKVKSAARGAQLAKRILPEVDVKLLIRAARTERDRVLLAVGYGGGLRVSELVGLKWGDVIAREKQVQLSVLGKGGVVRQVLLPNAVSRQLLEHRGDAGANDPVFAARHGGPLTERAVHSLVKRTARAAGISEAVSPHWLRHAHGSHAIDRGAPLPEVQATAWPRQRRDDQRLSPRPSRYVERALSGRGDFQVTGTTADPIAPSSTTRIPAPASDVTADVSIFYPGYCIVRSCVKCSKLRNFDVRAGHGTPILGAELAPTRAPLPSMERLSDPHDDGGGLGN